MNSRGRVKESSNEIVKAVIAQIGTFTFLDLETLILYAEEEIQTRQERNLYGEQS